jgi:hypothetical protein
MHDQPVESRTRFRRAGGAPNCNASSRKLNFCCACSGVMPRRPNTLPSALFDRGCE